MTLSMVYEKSIFHRIEAVNWRALGLECAEELSLIIKNIFSFRHKVTWKTYLWEFHLKTKTPQSEEEKTSVPKTHFSMAFLCVVVVAGGVKK